LTMLGNPPYITILDNLILIEKWLLAL
jgi:hypothetical protein